MREEFDFDAALAALQDGHGLTGKDGILTPLIRQLTEAALQAEMDAHLQMSVSGSDYSTVQNGLAPFDPTADTGWHNQSASQWLMWLGKTEQFG